MRNRTTQWTAVSGAALIALALGASVPALADGNEATASQRAHQQRFEQMQARMQTMHALMNQIHQTTDPAAQQKLMDQQYELMRNQMKDMGTMHDCMIGHGMSEHGMTGQQMMGHGMKQPGSQSQADGWRGDSDGLDSWKSYGLHGSLVDPYLGGARRPGLGRRFGRT